MLKQSKKVFFLGIKGVAMTNLAVFLKKMGKDVTGCDLEEVFITDALLAKNNISFHTGFKNVVDKDVDLVVYSAAHGGINNAIVRDALKRNINVIHQADLIGELMKEFEVNIAVAGCHGKTTTSSFIAYALHELKTLPSYLVGVPFFSGYQGVEVNSKKNFFF
jgi:UDP-N-acetylmuramate--alanine ligase